MSRAIIFPGQGSQSVGMGRGLASQYLEAREVFEAVDDALGEKLSAVIWNGPDEEVTLTENAQPALMAVSLATFRVLENQGFNRSNHADYVAGHSLGECVGCVNTYGYSKITSDTRQSHATSRSCGCWCNGSPIGARF